MLLTLLQGDGNEDSELRQEIILGTVFFVLCLAMAASHLLEVYKIHWLHESAAGILLGLIFGALVLVIQPDNISDFQFDDNFFFSLLLPPIIFGAAYNLKKKNFFAQFRLIMALGVVGTFINYFIIGTVCLQINKAGWISTQSEGSDFRLDHGECLLFGAIMSPSDSVTVCTLLNPSLYPSLFGVLSGEGIVNDALAIALYRTTLSSIGDNEGPGSSFPEPDLIGSIFGQFLLSLLVSSLIGVAAALICGYYLKSQREKPHPKREVAIVYLVALTSYALCEVIEFSGIIALLFCGLTMSHYTHHNLSPAGKLTAREGYETLSFVAEMFLYVSLGFYVFHYTDVFNWSFVFFISMLITLFISRAICVILICNFVNYFQKEKYKMNWKRMILIWWGGSIRGAIAFALSVDGESRHKSVLVTTTFAIVMVTTLFMGGSTMVTISVLKLEPIPFKPKRTVTKSELQNMSWRNLSTRGFNVSTRGQIHNFFRKFDDTYMKPLFGGRDRDVPKDDGHGHGGGHSNGGSHADGGRSRQKSTSVDLVDMQGAADAARIKEDDIVFSGSFSKSTRDDARSPTLATTETRQ